MEGHPNIEGPKQAQEPFLGGPAKVLCKSPVMYKEKSNPVSYCPEDACLCRVTGAAFKLCPVQQHSDNAVCENKTRTKALLHKNVCVETKDQIKQKHCPMGP